MGNSRRRSSSSASRAAITPFFACVRLARSGSKTRAYSSAGRLLPWAIWCEKENLAAYFCAGRDEQLCLRGSSRNRFDTPWPDNDKVSSLPVRGHRTGYCRDGLTLREGFGIQPTIEAAASLEVRTSPRR